MRLASIAALALLLVAGDLAAQGGGGGGAGRQRAGAQNPGCGSDLVVVLPNGEKRQYASIAEFLKPFDTVLIDQGEQQRPAVPVDVVLKSLGGDWMEALDCENHSKQLPSGLPFEGREYLVLTGKRGLKAVREIRSGSYGNTLQQIRKLTVHTAGGHGAKR
jgi:hypothetical protein